MKMTARNGDPVKSILIFKFEGAASTLVKTVRP